jgi:hypothetical protein
VGSASYAAERNYKAELQLCQRRRRERDEDDGHRISASASRATHRDGRARCADSPCGVRDAYRAAPGSDDLRTQRTRFRSALRAEPRIALLRKLRARLSRLGVDRAAAATAVFGRSGASCAPHLAGARDFAPSPRGVVPSQLPRRTHSAFSGRSPSAERARRHD